MGKQEIKVKEYKDAKEFDKDAQKMAKDGWEIRDQSQGSTHTNWGRTIFTTAATLGLNMVTPKIGGASFTKGKVIVTWVKGAEKKKCPECAEEILKEASVCRHCGHKFGEQDLSSGKPEMEQVGHSQQAIAAPVLSADGVIAKLERLAALKSHGILTDDEFAAQKKVILGS